jgi:hypothetical protein
MWNRVPVVVALVAALSVTASLFKTRSSKDHASPRATGSSIATECGPVESLNQCIQTMLHDGDGFGLSRLPVVPQHVPRFSPETEKEKATVAALREAGWEVGLYLGGRGLLNPGMTEAEWEAAGVDSVRRAISEPILITEPKPSPDLPRPWELWADGQKALVASAVTDSYTSSFGRWTIEARPVRADRKSCLKCHASDGANPFRSAEEHEKHPLRVGDALGVVIYVYAKAAK